MVHDIGALTGGAEHSLRKIRRELIRRGHEVRAVTGDRPAPEPEFRDYVFTSRDATVAGKLLHYLYNFSAKRTVAAAVRDFQPDVIHACTVTRLSPAGVKAMRGIPTVMDLRDYGLMYPLLHKHLPRDEFCGFGDGACCPRHAGLLHYYFEVLRVHLHRRRFRQISAFIVNSEYARRLAEELDMKPAVVLHSPIDCIPAPANEPRIAHSVLYAGRLEPEKGVLELLDAFELVLKSLPDAQLLFAGGGGLGPELESRINRRGLSGSVRMLGLLSKPDLHCWYRKIRLVVVPSLWPEPFGLVGPEAMARGVPVVASGRGGISDWLHDGENGLIADPCDAHQMADAITRLLTDDSLFQAMSRKAIESVSKFRLDLYVDNLEQLYDEAIANSNRLRS